MEAEATRSAYDLIREHSWILILGVMAVVVIFRLATGMIKWGGRGNDANGRRDDPDSLRDLKPTLNRTRLQVILATIAILAFTIIAILNSL